jgi:hypothetical protein
MACGPATPIADFDTGGFGIGARNASPVRTSDVGAERIEFLDDFRVAATRDSLASDSAVIAILMRP